MKTSDKILILFVIVATCASARVTACKQIDNNNGVYGFLLLNPLNPDNLWKSKETPQELEGYSNFVAFVNFCAQQNMSVLGFKKLCDERSSNGMGNNQKFTMNSGQSRNNSSQQKITSSSNIQSNKSTPKSTNSKWVHKFGRKDWIDDQGNAYIHLRPKRFGNKKK